MSRGSQLLIGREIQLEDVLIETGLVSIINIINIIIFIIIIIIYTLLLVCA